MNNFLVEIEDHARKHIKERRNVIKHFKGRHRVPRFVIKRLRAQKNAVTAQILKAIRRTNTWTEFLRIEGLCNLFFPDQKPEKIEKALKVKKENLERNHH